MSIVPTPVVFLAPPAWTRCYLCGEPLNPNDAHPIVWSEHRTCAEAEARRYVARKKACLVSATVTQPTPAHVTRIPAIPRYVVESEPAPCPRPEHYRPRYEVIDTWASGRCVVARRVRSGEAWWEAERLNAGWVTA